MPTYPVNHHYYTYLWNKYRPAILKLMVDAADGPQNYKFATHEFKDVNPKEKGGYAFSLEIFKGKSQTDIRSSVVAQDLLIVLQKSGRALELFETASYQYVMDKQFNLTVTKGEDVVIETDKEAAPEAAIEEEKPKAEETKPKKEEAKEADKPEEERATAEEKK